ncbi:ATP-binding cassette domain-containing protein [Solimonas variicoloris]|uniref:ATP-binding cassette domain-containing protein n=1 Tax=Solimonas variicoloris TaxID=254408 RepID=UPI000367F3B9|nr:ATP-binding cassette domain-containing protein [Solimonas variicoloris]
MNGDAVPPSLRVVRLSKRYGALRALDGLDLSIAPGEFVALLGPNGAGKSTLFQLLTALFVADAGVIEVDGVSLAQRPSAALARIGVVFQQPTLDLDTDALANLRFHARLHGLGHAGLQRAPVLLAELGLSEQAARPCRLLSGGNRRKVELARALLTQPRLLLMDEPTVGLDPLSRRQLLDSVRRRCADDGLAVLWATHLVDEAEAADRVLVLHRGRCRAEGSPAAIVAAQQAPDLQSAFVALTREPAPGRAEEADA